MIPVSPDLIRKEVASAKEILEQWETKLKDGIPHLEVPGGEDAMAKYLNELCGELKICANKCHSLAATVSGED